MRPGQDLVIGGFVGLGGTVYAAGRLEERLLSDCGMTDFEKLAQLQALLSLPETAAVLSRSGCDPQFRNLAARGAFLEHLRATISDLGGDPGCIPDAQYQS